jgi:hypothetical protein
MSDVDDPCCEMLDVLEAWFVCTLETGHGGPHQAREYEDDGHSHPYLVQWDQEPAVVDGTVVQAPLDLGPVGREALG